MRHGDRRAGTTSRRSLGVPPGSGGWCRREAGRARRGPSAAAPRSQRGARRVAVHQRHPRAGLGERDRQIRRGRRLPLSWARAGDDENRGCAGCGEEVDVCAKGAETLRPRIARIGGDYQGSPVSCGIEGDSAEDGQRGRALHVADGSDACVDDGAKCRQGESGSGADDRAEHQRGREARGDGGHRYLRHLQRVDADGTRRVVGALLQLLDDNRREALSDRVGEAGGLTRAAVGDGHGDGQAVQLGGCRDLLGQLRGTEVQAQVVDDRLEDEGAGHERDVTGHRLLGVSATEVQIGRVRRRGLYGDEQRGRRVVPRRSVQGDEGSACDTDEHR
ncbi:unnamed protein product [Penicillium discolor]